MVLTGDAGFVSPDLAVEILLPSNTTADNEERIRDLLAAGTRLIWILDPETESAEVRGPGGRRTQIAREGQLDGEDVIPGFRLLLEEVFRRPSR